MRKYLRISAILMMTVYGCVYHEEICDTIDVSYSEVIAPTLDANCTSCHSGKTPAEGLDLTDYEQVSDSLTSVKILEVIQLELGSDGVMPPSPNSPLSDCQILLLKNWVGQGRLNN